MDSHQKHLFAEQLRRFADAHTRAMARKADAMLEAIAVDSPAERTRRIYRAEADYGTAVMDIFLDMRGESLRLSIQADAEEAAYERQMQARNEERSRADMEYDAARFDRAQEAEQMECPF